MRGRSRLTERRQRMFADQNELLFSERPAAECHNRAESEQAPLLFNQVTEIRWCWWHQLERQWRYLVGDSVLNWKPSVEASGRHSTSALVDDSDHVVLRSLQDIESGSWRTVQYAVAVVKLGGEWYCTPLSLSALRDCARDLMCGIVKCLATLPAWQ